MPPSERYRACSEGSPRLGFTSVMVAALRGIAGTKALRIGGRLLAAALVVAIGVRLWQLWHHHPVDFGTLDGGIFSLAVLASGVAVTAYGLVWPYILRKLGTDAPFTWVGLFLKSQLGKYLPGSVWQYAGRVALARDRGVPVGRAVVSLVAELVLSTLAAGVVGFLVLGPAEAGIAFGGFVALVFAGITSRERLAEVDRRLTSPLRSRLRLDRGDVVAAVHAAPLIGVLYLVVWILYGLAFWLTGRALFAVPITRLPAYVGVFALAWLVGLIAVFAPGGVGVREAVIVALLRNRLGEANAIVLAAASRIVLTAIDLVAGTASLYGAAIFRRQSTSPAQAKR